MMFDPFLFLGLNYAIAAGIVLWARVVEQSERYQIRRTISR